MRLILALFFLAMQLPAHAQTAQETLDNNMKNAKEVTERQQKERDKEMMRDKSHDNRLMINKDTSLGVNKGGVNVRTTRGQ
ncbi:E3 ubiquitin-protein ligase DOA10 [Bradyrhizobium sp. LB8.2]|uniref:hypothetical protein n=1 Tax=unclassified Bradyrhizobium TaxID=2631580 RepID=UPI003399A588